MAGKTSKTLASREKTSAHKKGFIATIVLVIALPEERGYFHSVVSGRNAWTVPTQLQRYRCEYKARDGIVQVVVQTLAAMGHIEAVAGASAAIASSSPDLVVMIGIAGSLDHKRVGLGDVVVANRVKLLSSDKVATHDIKETDPQYCFDDGKSSTETPPKGEIWIDHRDRFLKESYLRYERRAVELEDVDDLISISEARMRACSLEQLDLAVVPEKFRALPSITRHRALHIGWLLGNHHVVDSAEYREYLVEKNSALGRDIHHQKGDFNRIQWPDGDLLAVDMESYGVLRAVKQVAGKSPSVGGCKQLLGGIAIRGISDMCESKGHLDKTTQNGIRGVAARNATEVALTLIEGLDYATIALDRDGRPWDD